MRMPGGLVVVGGTGGVGGSEEMRARRRRIGTGWYRCRPPGLRWHDRRHVDAVEPRRAFVAQSSRDIDTSPSAHTDHGLVALRARRSVAYDREIDGDDREEDDDEQASKPTHLPILHR